MKKYFFVLFIISQVAFAQKKDITNQEIWNFTFYPRALQSLESMKGDYYSVLENNRNTRSTSVEKYSFKTLEKIKTIVSSNDLKSIDQIESYNFNSNETELIIGTNSEQIYRHSSISDFFVYILSSKKLIRIDAEKIQKPTFSPDGKKIAFVKNNNIYFKDLSSNKTTQVTFNGKKNEIINGICDWVYEEEFSFVRAFEWSKDSKKLAFLRFDETEVPSYSMDVVGENLYPFQQVFKYPKAGEKNSEVSLHIFNLENSKTNKIDLGDYEYIPRLKWSNKDNILSVITLNRHQNNLNLFFVNSNTNTAKVILNETSKTYVDIHDNLVFLNDNSFIWTSEKDGFNHIYHYNSNGSLKKQVTKGNWEVTDFYGINNESNTIYYQSVENGSINRTIYSVELNGTNKKLLTNSSGTNSATFSNDYNYFINNFSDVNTPPIYTLHSSDGKLIKEILNNNYLIQKLENYNITKREFFTLETKNGDFNSWIIKPSNFDENKKYPLLMTQYSGPGSQSVSNSWNTLNDYWYHLIAEKGYIVVCVDGRGTGFRGNEFKTVTYLNMGKYEVFDQIESAKELSKRKYIDKDNIGIWGWSYGGFMSANCILKGNDVFKLAIAVAPVTNWRFYDSIYTERFMRTPQENADGYDENSPLNFAKLLKGKFLIVHGSGDDNVHIQNSLRMQSALIEANKPFDSEVYPDRAHGIFKGNNTRLHLFNKMTTFITENLKTNNN